MLGVDTYLVLSLVTLSTAQNGEAASLRQIGCSKVTLYLDCIFTPNYFIIGGE